MAARAATKEFEKKLDKAKPESHGRAIRETIESILVAVVLALMFRAYEAEAFIIPTGSNPIWENGIWT